MLATLVIGLREGLEASLIVGIIAAFLRRRGQSLRGMWVGVAAAVALSVAVGVALQVVESSLPQADQEAMESVIGAVAVVFVTSMIVWMHHHARSMRAELEASASEALRGGASSALAVMAFLAVLKEGFETSVFLLATFSAASSTGLAALGAVVGVLAAVAIGYGIYTGGVHLDLRRFFRVTGVFLVFVAAGLVLTVLRTAHEAGWVTVGQQRTLDLSWLAPAGTVRAALVTGVLGVPADPRAVEVLAWCLYLVPVLALVLWPARWRPAAAAVPRLKAGVAAGLLLAAAALAVAVPAAATGGSGAVRLVTTSGASAGTARLAAGGPGAPVLVLRTAGTTRRTTLTPARAVADARGGVAAVRTDDVRTAHLRGLPGALSLGQLIAVAGGRLPVGVSATSDPGPFTAVWTTRTTTSAWTASGVLLDATRSASTTLTLSGGGLATPRTITVAPSVLSAAGAREGVPAGWHAAAAEVRARTVALASAGSRAAERDLWRRDLPLVLALAAVGTAASAVLDRRRPSAPRPASDVRRAAVRPHPTTIRS